MLLMFDYRSISPKSRDGKVKKEKNIKAEEEEEETKKKEKVKNCLAFHLWFLVCVLQFKFHFRSNLCLWKSFLPRRRQQRKQRQR